MKKNQSPLDKKISQMTEDEFIEFLAECEMKASVLEITVDYYMHEFL